MLICTEKNEMILKKSTEDRIFTISGLKKEFHRIRWPKMLAGETENEKTVIPTVISVLGFIVFLSLFFIALNGIGALCLSAIN